MTESQGATSTFPFGKLLALLAVVAMTALPFASCGMIDFKGHELLRNHPPEMSGMDDIAKSLDMTGTSGVGDAPVKPTVKTEKRESLFTGDDAWLHWVYIVTFLHAIAAIFVPARSRMSLLLGVGGVAGVFIFLLGFDSMLGREAPSEKGVKISVKWEIGAYLATAAFAGVAVTSALARRKPSSG